MDEIRYVNSSSGGHECRSQISWQIRLISAEGFHIKLHGATGGKTYECMLTIWCKFKYFSLHWRNNNNIQNFDLLVKHRQTL